METGWTAVMIDASDKLYAENLAPTRQVMAAAKHDIGVEAEIGEIGGVEEDLVVAEEDGHLADADQALQFCREAPGLAGFAWRCVRLPTSVPCARSSTIYSVLNAKRSLPESLRRHRPPEKT